MMTLGAETKIYAVQIQDCRYYDPAAPWETVLCTHSEDAAMECADGNAGHGERTRYEEERAKAVADAIARAGDAQRDGIEEAET